MRGPSEPSEELAAVTDSPSGEYRYRLPSDYRHD